MLLSRLSLASVVKIAFAGLLSLVLASCNSVRFEGFGTPGTPFDQSVLGAPTGNRIVLLLPLTATGNAGATALSLKNAAEMAMSDLAATNVQLIIKDTGGTPGGAQAAATEAIAEGASIILGPLFAQSVQAVRPIATANSVPVIAFSSDANVGGRGVYLLSFLPESDVNRAAEYASSNGKVSAAILVPDNAYGLIAETSFRQTAAQRGMRIVSVERYPSTRDGMEDPAKRTAQAMTRASARADVAFVPAVDASYLAALMTVTGYRPANGSILGTGQWDVPETYRENAIQGGWFAGPDPSGWNSFKQRYQGRFGQAPARIATLSYDGVRLAAELTRTSSGGPVPYEAITVPRGFVGIDGIFRFKQDGSNERGLAVMQVTSGGPRVLSPAPRSWGSGGLAGN